MSATQQPPLSLYIHIPWCVRKCPYCDFNSHKLTQPIDEQQYIQHLIADFNADYQPHQHRPIHSIFFGGGTPSLFSAKSLEILLNHLQRHAKLSQECEITLEANPGTAEQQRFSDYRQIGINRLSLGIQSFDKQKLHSLGRIHNSDEAHRAITLAHRAGFERLNLDLMFALPEQSPEQMLTDLQQAIDYQPEHISWYQLTLEPNTPFYQNPPPLPNDDQQIQLYELGSAYLKSHHYQQYETSAWTNNRQSQHNLNYWQFGDYIGIGAGAHGKLTHPDKTITRTRKYRAPTAYQHAGNKSSHQNPYLDQHLIIKKEEQAFEFMMNALRLQQGVPTHYLTTRTQLTHPDLKPILDQLSAKKLLRPNHSQHLQTTARGFALLNDVLTAFL